MVAAGAFTPIRGAVAFQIARVITGIGHTMDIATTRGITMAAGTIRIGVTGIGMGTDRHE